MFKPHSKTFEKGDKVISVREIKTHEGVFSVNHEFTVDKVSQGYEEGKGNYHFLTLVDSENRFAYFVDVQKVKKLRKV